MPRRAVQQRIAEGFRRLIEGPEQPSYEQLAPQSVAATADIERWQPARTYGGTVRVASAVGFLASASMRVPRGVAVHVLVRNVGTVDVSWGVLPLATASGTLVTPPPPQSQAQGEPTLVEWRSEVVALGAAVFVSGAPPTFDPFLTALPAAPAQVQLIPLASVEGPSRVYFEATTANTTLELTILYREYRDDTRSE